jgi:hypothetical protein
MGFENPSEVPARIVFQDFGADKICRDAWLDQQKTN